MNSPSGGCRFESCVGHSFFCLFLSPFCKVNVSFVSFFLFLLFFWSLFSPLRFICSTFCPISLSSLLHP
ncbi:hypothetical protein SODALDRAFT_19312 [Sodiomyces alkalinus F11]|uniref:Uncharacterized protein n=1 Tax=Sodiomyces alkalinus (strain CBS 110278 / VKM F-3762 / F11) TaxID=1314773 RepID=A0A3N2Q7C5_SODAK|nr:hypothetical protein SODALDRAFT_19312 [Sodiomyces alkalinus F11]ROT42616.1 hypothetical protein SODALDRAFT_19312 [Sodiomyces alkalinus F11]